jgi:hypothetical protein
MAREPMYVTQCRPFPAASMHPREFLFSKAFRREQGVTFRDYPGDVRIQVAARLLN